MVAAQLLDLRGWTPGAEWRSFEGGLTKPLEAPPMATRLDKTLKRELEIEGKLYTVTISPEGVKITPKGARKGPEMTWQTLLSGDAELRRDLNASVDAYSG
jgi:hypothetical protein